MTNKKSFIFMTSMIVIFSLYMVPAAAQQETVEAKTVERLERLIKEQQQQLESLQRQLN